MSARICKRLAGAAVTNSRTVANRFLPSSQERKPSNSDDRRITGNINLRL